MPSVTHNVAIGGVNGSSTLTDANTANNTAMDNSLTTAAASDLGVTLTSALPNPVVSGSNLVYTFVVTNNGPTNTTNAQLTGFVPPGTTFVSLTQTPAGTFTFSPALSAATTGQFQSTATSLTSGVPVTLT